MIVGEVAKLIDKNGSVTLSHTPEGRLTFIDSRSERKRRVALQPFAQPVHAHQSLRNLTSVVVYISAIFLFNNYYRRHPMPSLGQ